MGRESLSQILSCFWDSTSHRLNLMQTRPQLSTGGPVSNQAGVAGGAMRLKVCKSYSRADLTGIATEGALRPGC